MKREELDELHYITPIVTCLPSYVMAYYHTIRRKRCSTHLLLSRKSKAVEHLSSSPEASVYMTTSTCISTRAIL